VSRNVVRREVRSPPLSESAARPDLPADGLVLAFVSESGYCRAPLAAAAARRALSALNPPLSAPVVICEALASRDYCAGRGPSPDAAAVAAARGLADGAFSSSLATPFLPATHAVRADLLAVVDRFVAADVLREVTVFDTIAAGETAAFGSKVRLLGGFAAAGSDGSSSSAVDALVAASAAGEGEDSDIDDPLYGNGGGPEQRAAVEDAAAACEAGAGGLVSWLGALDREAVAAGVPLRAALSNALGTAGEITWLVPPMLAPRG
jgi:protein-tyrosine-phosphatase